MSGSSRPTMVIAGGRGLIGRHLIAAAGSSYRVVVLTRASGAAAASNPPHAEPPRSDRANGREAPATPVEFVRWRPDAARASDHRALDALAATLSGSYAVVNLAGVSLSAGRLDANHKQQVLDSRVDSTTTLAEALARTATPPRVVFQMSAVGYYGDQGDTDLYEASPKGSNSFLADVCEAWEAAAAPMAERSRLVIGRGGLVLAADASAWQRLLLPIRWFVGGPLGSGRQWYAWIDGDDLAHAILHLLETPSSRGVYNLTAPEPVRQLELTRKIAARLGRPALLPAPAPLLRLVLGEAADELLLASTRALPGRLLAEGFAFEYPEIDDELDKLLPVPVAE